MTVGLLTLHIELPGCSSLKDKRHRLKPLLNRLHREFNISVAEVGLQDTWQYSLIAISIINSDQNQIQRVLQQIITWIDHYWQDITIIENKMELIH